MKFTSFVFAKVICLLFFNSMHKCVHAVLDQQTYNVSLETYDTRNKQNAQEFTKRITFLAKSNITLNIVNISNDISFVTAQVHTHMYNVTLSYDKTTYDTSNNRSVSGRNIALYIDTDDINEAQIFAHNLNNANVSALFAIVAYSNEAPIPGGCNMEFNLKISPFHKIHETGATVIVDIQPASRPRNSVNKTICDKEQSIEYNTYLMYLSGQDFTEETYFSSIEKMLTPQSIEHYASKMPLSTFGSAMRRIYSAYSGTGSTYATVALYGNYSSAYVPALTYACNPLNKENSCDIITDRTSFALCGLTFFVGLVVTFFGRRLFKMEMFLMGCFAGGIIGYILSSGIAKFDTAGNAAAALIFGVITGIIWWTLWLYFENPLMLILLSSMTLGFIFSSIIYYSIPPGTYFVEVDAYFWLAFLSIMFLIGIIITAVPYFNIRLCCSILGSYAIILPIDYYIGSNIKYIIINIIRRATYSGFNVAIIYPPFQYKDVLLVTLWIFLTCLSLFKQSLLFSKSPYRSI